MMWRPVLLVLLSLLGACAGADGGAQACPAGMQAAQRVELFFGRDIRGGGEVSDEAVDAFLADTLTPTAPDGLTVIAGRGQWRHGDGHVARERSLLVVLMLPGASAADAQARIAPVVQAWLARFGQESVLRSASAACVGF